MKSMSGARIVDETGAAGAGFTYGSGVNRLLARLVVLAVLVPGLVPSRASACSCMAQTVEEAVASSAAIFEARVVSEVDEGGTMVVTFAVTQAWGGVDHETISVRTARDSAACGFDFQVDETYLVYANGEADALTVSLCSRTARLLDAAADRAALGSGVIPVDVVDEAVEPVRPARTEPPARGGCASCAVSASEPPALALLGVALVMAILARRKNHP